MYDPITLQTTRSVSCLSLLPATLVFLKCSFQLFPPLNPLEHPKFCKIGCIYLSYYLYIVTHMCLCVLVYVCVREGGGGEKESEGRKEVDSEGEREKERREGERACCL